MALSIPQIQLPGGGIICTYSKECSRKVTNQRSLAFFNRHFLVPKPNNKWTPILDLSSLNKYLISETFKMETPESISTSLQTGEWEMSIDFKDAYFHIPRIPQSWKYLRFHVQGQFFQFKALPFGLSTAPIYNGNRGSQSDCSRQGYKFIRIH